MNKYSATTILPNGAPYSQGAGPKTVIIDANGGSVTIEANMGDGTWIELPDSPYSADTVIRLDVSGTQFRFTPASGATFAVGG
jgi:phage tail protein X